MLLFVSSVLIPQRWQSVLSRAVGGVAQLFGCCPPTCHPAARDDDLLPHLGQLDPEVSLEEDETTLETSGTFPKHEPQST